MNIYKIEQFERRGYDTYDSAVVIAADAKSASLMHPSRFSDQSWDSRTWADCSDDVKVTFLGVSEIDVAQVVVASFNAG